ncbi:hypothetical protein [Bacillus sp. FJAT-50079]|uniref:hypothetical protein n=1 Tax=Bacillus sp. FJAT-50079 TaxID=2833577 RepID=UPI001BCA4978|nr:hypothetical protein [Bacillus sp. FJAT-50079]MBS4207021.1 hypothetical protein [Bacillus sp. FJAT-50079]
MRIVHFKENKNTLLVQLRKDVPSVGEEIKVKGRKGKVIGVQNFDEKNFYVQVIFESKNKNKLPFDPKKKRR